MTATGCAVQTALPGVSTPGDEKGDLASFGLRHEPVSVKCGSTTASLLFVSVRVSTSVQLAHGFYLNYGSGQKTLMPYGLACARTNALT